jgi:hypothetical protein
MAPARTKTVTEKGHAAAVAKYKSRILGDGEHQLKQSMLQTDRS